MKKVTAGFAGAALVIGSMSMAATTAQAYDTEAFAYAASHFLSEKDLPAAFASKGGMNINVSTTSGKTFVCTSPSPDGPDVTLAKPVRNSIAFYQPIKKSLTLSIAVNEYRSNTAAEKAFAQLTKDIKKCDGDATGSWTDDSGTVYPYENVVTSGKIPAVTVTGVASIFTNENSNNLAVQGQPAYLNDNMNIYTLVNNAIIVTEGSTGSALNFTAKQKKALEKVAFDMVSTWVD
ncbi:MAG: hypothetical protein K9G05_06580 [Candidatus Nanopelagicales bacterium]|nr:hypothetical protein [Candidatus Nanopelagicales bacterium]MCF8551725.1 hypothetical protein [Candidatus Nanopelagicales bacterium]